MADNNDPKQNKDPKAGSSTTGNVKPLPNEETKPTSVNKETTGQGINESGRKPTRARDSKDED